MADTHSLVMKKRRQDHLALRIFYLLGKWKAQVNCLSIWL